METNESNKYIVGITRYEKPLESLRTALDLCDGLKNLSKGAKVFIKPNIVFWTVTANFPKWGVITTSRVIEDMVVLLKEHGAGDICIGEGIVLRNPKDKETPRAAFESLGYDVLRKRYGVKCVNVHERPFKKIEIMDGIHLNFNLDAVESDFFVDLPVLKTHAQTVVSLSIKNLKGLLDMNSRKKCHSPDPDKNLNHFISCLPDPLPKGVTVLDGIFTTERGPGVDGKVRRSNILVASTDLLSADMVGAKLLGYDPSQVPYIVYRAEREKRPPNFDCVHIKGEEIEEVSSPHQYTFPYTEDGSLPLPLKRMGIDGLSYPKFDLTLCTYCSLLAGPLLTAIALTWKGKPWGDVEVLTGKVMQPTPGKKKTILLGKCMYKANKDNPNINELIAVKGCPPAIDDVINAFHRAGIEIDPSFSNELDKWPSLFMKKYEGKPEFDEAFFRIV